MSSRPVGKFLQETHHPVLKAPQLEWSNPQDLLKVFESRAAEQSKSAKPKAVVFDLDSTLFCTAPRLKSILMNYVNRNPQLDPHWAKVVHLLDSSIQRYSVPETLYGILQRFALDRDAKELTKEFWLGFESHWKEEFFLSRNMVVDPPYEGAVAFVEATQKLGFEVVYLTGRDFERGMDGTRHALRRWSYPLGAGTHTVLKPDRTHQDLAFKKRIAEILAARFEISAVIDNEPENLLMFGMKVPSAEIILFHSIMSRRWTPEYFRQWPTGKKLLGLKSFVE